MSPALVEDLTALFLRADRLEYQEGHFRRAVVLICEQYGDPVGDDSRIARAEALAEFVERLPSIPGYSIQVVNTHDRDAITSGIRALGLVA